MNFHSPKKAFEYACRNGHLELAQNLWTSNDKLNNYNNVFRDACKNGHLDVAQWFYSVKPDMDISSYNDFAFRMACANGNLFLAQWLYSVKPTLDISVFKEYAFRKACFHGHLQVAQWLYSVKPTLHISAMDEEAFRMACKNGHLQTVQWLLSINHGVDIYDQAFHYACRYNNLAVAQWLYSAKPDLDISKVFRNACMAGQLDVAKRILLIKPDLDITTENDEAFRFACRGCHSVVALWLVSLCPNKYQILSHNIFNIRYKILGSGSIKIVGTLAKTTNEEECGICRETICNIATECHHQFCQTCISNWLKTSSSCPTCRHFLSWNTSVFRKLV